MAGAASVECAFDGGGFEHTHECTMATTRIEPAPGGGVYLFFEVDADCADSLLDLTLDIDGAVVKPDAWYDITRLRADAAGDVRVFGTPMLGTTPTKEECMLPDLVMSGPEAQSFAEQARLRIESSPSQ